MFTLTKAVGLFLSLMAQHQTSDKDFKALGEITGTDSAIEQPLSAMITDQKTMTALWRRHKELFGEETQQQGQTQVLEAQVPQVDFKKNIVITYFAGQTQGIMGFEIINVDVKGKTNVVRIAPKEFPSGGSVLANAFGMWVFPKTTKTIELELVVGYENRQPVVKKVARFEAPKPVKS